LKLKKKGFEISLELDESKEEILFWVVKKGDDIVSAFTPLSLLALVVIYEQYGDIWNCVDAGDIYEEILGSY
jgi:hypothetical protein